MLGVLVTILTVILVFICLLMSLVILMQRPKQEGLGAAFGGGLTDRMLGSGTTDFLQRATVFMGVSFFLLSLTIATLMAYDRNAERKSLSEEIKQVAADKDADDPATTQTVDLGTTPPALPGANEGSVPPAVVPVPELEENTLPTEDLSLPVTESETADTPDASDPASVEETSEPTLEIETPNIEEDAVNAPSEGDPAPEPQT